MRFILKQVRHIGWFWNAFVFWVRHLDWHVRKADGLRLNAPLYCDGTGQVSLGSDIAIGYGLFAILGDGTAISNNTQVFAEQRITVGAGSVVVRSIPPGVIAAGNPAKLIRPL